MRLIASVALVLSTVTFAVAAGPVGEISSPGSFQLHGNTVKTEGINSWPIVSGDEIVSGSTEALIHLRDGSSVVLSPDSKVVIDSNNGAAVVRLMSGDMQASPSAASRTQFFNNSHPVSVTPGATAQVGVKRPSTTSTGVARLLPPPPVQISSK